MLTFNNIPFSACSQGLDGRKPIIKSRMNIGKQTNDILKKCRNELINLCLYFPVFFIEAFLTKWGIKDFNPLVESISALNAKHEKVNMACVPAMMQLLRHFDQVNQYCIIKVLLSQDNNNLNTKYMFQIDPIVSEDKMDYVDSFITALKKVPRLTNKLQCLQFSLDFPELLNKVTSRIQSVISACQTVNTSEKFINLINFIMSFLHCMNPDRQAKIYGFDIQVNVLTLSFFGALKNIKLLYFE